MFGRFYFALGIAVILLYGMVTFTGREFLDAQRKIIPADARQQPGGIRSFHYWRSGYRGGK